MSHSLYEEAIAEARRLREMAEENAKNKIIDAVTPQIRNLIEQELMGAPDDSMDPVEDFEDTEEVDFSFGDVPSEDDEVIDLDQMMPPLGQEKEESGGVNFTVSDDGEVEIEIGGTKIEIEPGESEDDEILLDKQMAEAVSKMIASRGPGRKQINKGISLLERKMGVLKKALEVARTQGNSSQKRKIATIFESLAREAIALRNQVMITESKTGSSIPERNIVNSIIKEMKQMSRRNNRNIFDFLFEAEEGEEMSDLELDDAEEEEGMEDMDDIDVDLEAAEDAVLDLTDALGLDMGGMGDDEDEEFELDLVDDEEELEEGGYMMGEEEVYEIDESVLHQELNRMRRLQEGDPVAKADNFGGGEAGDEPFIEVDEETLLNALADELGDAPMPTMMGESRRRRRARRPRHARVQRPRTSGKHLHEAHKYKRAARELQGQLVEMNLFNAKLLYANKLMQNKNLTAKQERAIVEALDNAKTLREAKLLYKSLSKSFGKGRRRGSLNESRSLRTRGSASKSARSAQPSNAAGSTDRWAVLAGIKQDN